MHYTLSFLKEAENWKTTSVINEVRFKASLSSGSGGQNVNKVSSKMELYWNPSLSTFLETEAKTKIIFRLNSRLSNEGEIRLVCDEERSQFMNKEKLILKFYRLLASCFIEQKSRKPSKPTRTSIANRLGEKKLRKDIKKGRGKIDY